MMTADQPGVFPTIERTAPLLPVAAGLIAGIVLDRYALASWHIYAALFAVVSAAALARPMSMRFRMLLALTASTCVGGMLHYRATRIIPKASIERYATDTGSIARLCGEVISQPRILETGDNPFRRWSYQGDRTACLVEVTSIEGVDGDIPVTGRVRVTVNEAVLDLSEGERVELFGLLYKLQPVRNPGSFDWASFNRRQGVVAALRCDHQENVRRLDPTSPCGTGLQPAKNRPHTGATRQPAAEVQPAARSVLREAITWLRARARGLLIDDLTTGADEEASLLEAMVLGHRSKLDRHLNDVFIQAGCIHFLAVSGIHVIIVMLFARLTVRVMGLRRRGQIWAMMAAVVLYMLVVEPRPPILRASVIGLIYCVACLLGRERSCLNWISATVLVLALFDPPMVFDVGYQLSSAAVLGVSYLAPALLGACGAARRLSEGMIFKRPFAEQDRQLLRPSPVPAGGLARVAHRIGRWFRRYVPPALAITFAAWLAALPVVAIYFNRVHPWGPINSFLVLPPMSLVMALGFTKLFISMVSPGLGSLVAVPLVAVDSFLIWLAEQLASMPGATLPFAPWPWWLVVSYYSFLAAFAFRFSPAYRASGKESKPDTTDLPFHREPPTPPRWLSVTCLAACLGLALCAAVRSWSERVSDGMTVTFLAVGPGLCTVIELPDGRTVLYDAGTRSPYDVGRSTVVPFLRHRGISTVDRTYISHANFDHFSGLPTIIEEIDTGPLVVNRYFDAHSSPGSPSRHLLDMLAARGHAVETLELKATSWELGGARFELLGPVEPWSDTLLANDASTVLKISYAGHAILLTGDIESRAQQTLLQRGGLQADVLYLPHHGAVRPTLKAFLEAVEPSVLIRSSHERMDQTVTSGLEQIVQGMPLYNTADHGAIEVRLDRDGVHISTALPGG